MYFRGGARGGGRGLHYKVYFKGGARGGDAGLHYNCKDQEFTEAYVNLFRATQKFGNDSGNDIQLVEFANGYTLFVVDIDPALLLVGIENCLRPDKRGMVRLEAKFDNALAETINVIAYGEFQTVFEIDRARNVILDGAI